MKIFTLSPVHIGSGEETTPWEYGLGKGKLEIYNFESVVNELSLRFSGQRLKNLMLELRDLIKGEGFNRTLGEYLSEKNIHVEPLYRIDCKAKLGEVRHKGIKEFIKTGNKVYIPGSEIKGALRTLFIFGLIYRYAKKNDFTLISRLREIIEGTLKKVAEANPKEKSKLWDKANIQLEELILRPRGDAKYDIFKAVKVSDTSLVDPSQVLYVDTVSMVGSRRSFFDPHEVMKEGISLDFSLEISEDDKKALKKIYADSYMHERIDLLTFEFLHESSLSFHRFLLDIERKFFERHGRYDILKSLNNIGEALAKGDFVLRLGKHQGFLSITTMLPLYLGDKNFFANVFKNIFRNSRPEPIKTRKVTSFGKTLGWCRLIDINESKSKEPKDTFINGNDIREALKSKGWRVR